MLAKTHSRIYDSLNRLQQSIGADNQITEYGYNPLDQLTGVTDPTTHTTAYTINALGERSQLDSPDTGITDYDDYDAAGNLKQQTDAKGQITEYDYDALNRLETMTYHDNRTIDYFYDEDALGNPVANGIGRLIEIHDSTGSDLRYDYDPLGRITLETRVIAGQTYSTGYRYDSFGRLDRITYPSGRTIDYTFDALGRIDSISTTNSGNTQTDTIARNITWQPFGGVNGLTFGDPAGTNESYTRDYDLAGRIDDYTLAESLNTLTYDAASRIQSQSGENIAGPNLAALTETYTPDPNSNRIDSISASTTVNYAYDNNGSITSDGSYGYVYDARGRLEQITGTPLGTVSYQINALGQRVVKTSSLGTTVYHYDTQGMLIAESDSTGTVLREYVYLGMMPVAVIENGDVYFIHSDHLDTPRVVTNDSGVVIWRWVSDPFGEALADGDPDGNSQDFTLNLRFPGQVFDDETGLHYNYFRDYDPGTGRYVQSDPIGLGGGLNTYGYVDGNPLIYIDPRGLKKPDPTETPFLECMGDAPDSCTKCIKEVDECWKGHDDWPIGCIERGENPGSGPAAHRWHVCIAPNENCKKCTNVGQYFVCLGLLRGAIRK